LAHANAVPTGIYAIRQSLIAIARRLYVREPSVRNCGDQSTRSTQNHRSLSVSISWGRSVAKAAVKLHTLLDLRAHSTSPISAARWMRSLSEQLVPEPGAFYTWIVASSTLTPLSFPPSGQLLRDSR